MLSEMLGPKGVAFDNDEVLDDIDDEDLKNDPISQMDMTVRWLAAPRSHTLTLPYPRLISLRSSRSVPPEIPTTSRAFLTS